MVIDESLPLDIRIEARPDPLYGRTWRVRGRFGRRLRVMASFGTFSGASAYVAALIREGEK